MADRFATTIRIGGPVPRSVLPDLMDAINAEGLEDLQGRRVDSIDSEAKMLEFLEDGRLQFWDPERAWGMFLDLEEFLVSRGLAFDRSHSPHYEISGELVQFRPGMEAPAVAECNDGGVIVIEIPELQKVRDLLKRGGSRQEAIERLNALCREADFEPLPPFEIVD